MSNYITSSLEEGETIVLQGHLHWLTIFRYLAACFLGILLSVLFIYLYFAKEQAWYLYIGLGFLLFSVIIYLVGNLVRSRNEFAVTNSRFIQKEGILNIKITEIPLYKIETANFYQTFWQRIVGTGCIELVGSGGTPHQVHQIKDPLTVHRTIVATINKSTMLNDSETPQTKRNPFE